MLRDNLFLILICSVLFAGCITSEIQAPPVSDASDIIKNTDIAAPVVPSTSIPTPTFTQMPNYEKINLCKEKYPGTIFNSSTDKCERDNEKYCVVYFPGSYYNSLTKSCVFPTLTPTPTIITKYTGYEYCARNYPGSHYNPSTNSCLYQTPMPTSNPYNFNGYEHCARNYPGSHYDPSTNSCLYQTLTLTTTAQTTTAPTTTAPTTTAPTTIAPTTASNINWYEYCTSNYPGSFYDPSVHRCLWPPNYFYEYCPQNYPGTHYNPSTKKCEYN